MTTPPPPQISENSSVLVGTSLPRWSPLSSAATILSVHSLVDAWAPSELVKDAEIVFACPCVVEVEVGRPKLVDEQSIHIHTGAAVVRIKFYIC